MSLWFTLNNLWTDSLLPAFYGILDFFRRPLDSIFSHNVEGETNVIDDILIFLFDKFKDLLSLLGVDLQLPLWQFLIINTGLILTLLIAINFLNLLRG